MVENPDAEPTAWRVRTLDTPTNPLGILVGLFEEAGFKPAGVINAISYILWSLWLIAFGIALLLR